MIISNVRRCLQRLSQVTKERRLTHSHFCDGASARLVWCPPTTMGLSETDREQAGQMERIVENCSSLRYPEYIPPLGMGRWVNLGLQRLKVGLHPRVRYRRQEIQCPDGGLVCIDWADDEVTRKLPSTAPVVILLHTILGWRVSFSKHFAIYYVKSAFGCQEMSRSCSPS